MKITVEQAEKNHAAVVEHNNKEIAKIEKRIEALERSGKNHADLDDELKKVSAIAANTEARSLKILNEAKEQEDQALEKAQKATAQKSEEAEAKLKSKAMKAYVKSGGRVADFDSVWPSIRKKMLEASVLQQTEMAQSRQRTFIDM